MQQQQQQKEESEKVPRNNVKIIPNGTSLTIPQPDQDHHEDQDDQDSCCFYLSVASFNLLAPIYVRPLDKRTGTIQPFAAFDWVSEKDSYNVLDIQCRGPKLFKLLQTCNADVICLQELQLDKKIKINDNNNNNNNTTSVSGNVSESINNHDNGTNTKQQEQQSSFEIPEWMKPLVEDSGDENNNNNNNNNNNKYTLYLPPEEQLEIMAQRNLRVLDREVAVTCAILVKNNNNNNNNKFEKVIQTRDKDTNTCVSIGLQWNMTSSTSTTTETETTKQEQQEEEENESSLSSSSSSFMCNAVVTCVHLDATDEKKRVGQLSKCLERAKDFCLMSTSTSSSSSSSSSIIHHPISTIIAGDMNSEFSLGSCVRAFLVDNNENDNEKNEVSSSPLSTTSSFTSSTFLNLMGQECALAHRLPKGTAVGPSLEQMMNEWKLLHQQAKTTIWDNCCTMLDRIPTGTTRCAYDHHIIEEEINDDNDDNNDNDDMNSNNNNNKDKEDNTDSKQQEIQSKTAAETTTTSPTTTPTTPTMGQWKLDHLLYTKNTFQPYCYWSTLEADPESCQTGLPNIKWPSDHLPIGAIFQLQRHPPSPQTTMSSNERQELIHRLESLLGTQRNELKRKEQSLNDELTMLEASLSSNNNNNNNNTTTNDKEEQSNNDDSIESSTTTTTTTTSSTITTTTTTTTTTTKPNKKQSHNNKKKTKTKNKGPPPKEIMDFMRKKRSIMKEFKEIQREERVAIVKGLNDLQRLVIEYEFGYNAAQWIERG